MATPTAPKAARRPHWSIFAAAVILLTARCGSHSTPNLSSPQGRHSDFVVKKAASGVYLGAQVDTNGCSVHTEQCYQAQETDTENLEFPTLGRRLAFHNEYRSWSDLASITGDSSDPEIYGDITNNRVPVIALACDDNISNVYNLEDMVPGTNQNPGVPTDLANIKAALSTLKYPNTGQPYPVILRWYWEFNLDLTYAPGDVQDAPNGNACFAQDGTQASQFVNAWHYIHNALEPTLQGGVPNITFMWNPTCAVPTSDYPNPVSLIPYYPAISDVDWIGVDGYSKYEPDDKTIAPFDYIFENFFNDFDTSQFGNKPISITETGSCQVYGYPDDQGSYLQKAQSEIDGTSPYDTTAGAFMYFDAAGNYKLPDKQVCSWILNPTAKPPAQSGQQQFVDIGQDPNFAPFVTP